MTILLFWGPLDSLKVPPTLCTITHLLPSRTSSSTPATPSFTTSRKAPVLASHTHQGKCDPSDQSTVWLWNGRTRSASRMAFGQFGELNNVTDAHFGSQSMGSNSVTSPGSSGSNAVRSGACQSYSIVLV